MKTRELEAIFDSRKSFYDKAKVHELEDGTKVLTSYGTHVAEIKDGKLSVFGWYSVTTARHINEFAVQNGFPKMTKKEMLEYPYEKDYLYCPDSCPATLRPGHCDND